MSEDTMTPQFREFPKIYRYSREIVITEKIDGTNGLVYVSPEGKVMAGSRTTWLTLGKDNHGFAKWVSENAEALRGLGHGYHHGEWWGQGINRGYGLKEKRFSLFNVSKWEDSTKRPSCCYCVPVLYRGMMSEQEIKHSLTDLEMNGSRAALGFKPAEGVVIFHTQGNFMLKKTILHDEEPKSKVKE